MSASSQGYRAFALSHATTQSASGTNRNATDSVSPWYSPSMWWAIGRSAAKASSLSADAGIIEVVAARAPELLTVTVTDSGAGLPPGFDLENTTSLGLQIVRTLVEGELGGRISLRPRDGGGTIAVVDLPVRYEPKLISRGMKAPYPWTNTR